MRTVLLLPLALGCALCQAPSAPSQSAQASPAKSAEKGGEVAGQVVDAITGAPLAKAQVIMFPAGPGTGPHATRTAAGGRFLLPDVAPGKYHLRVERRGYVPQSYGARGRMQAGTELSLAAGQRLADIVVRMIPQAVITGKVLDEDGEPLAEVVIAVLRYGYIGGKRSLFPEGSGRTDDLGEFRIHSLAPGRYYIQATYNPAEMMTLSEARSSGPAEPAEGYVSTFYPSAKRATEAAPVEVAAGAELRGMQMTLLKAATYRIRGEVVNAVSGRQERNTRLMLAPKERDSTGFGFSRGGATPDKKGRFDIRGVLPGSYYVTAMWFDSGTRYSARQVVEVTDSNVEGVMLTISKGADITGRIRIDDSAGDTHADLTTIMVFLRPSEQVPMGVPVRPSTKEDGSFVIQNLPPGDYKVNVMAIPKGMYLNSVRLGDREVLESGLSLDSGGAAEALEVVLRPGTGQVDGSVLDEKQQPFSGAQVVLLPEPERRSQTHLVKMAATDQNGRFTLEGIAPGDYRLFAWKEVDYGAWLDPDFMKPFESHGEEISVREGSRETRQLKLLPSDGASAQ